MQFVSHEFSEENTHMKSISSTIIDGENYFIIVKKQNEIKGWHIDRSQGYHTFARRWVSRNCLCIVLGMNFMA